MKPSRSLKSKALQLLAQREQSRTELRRKLLAHAAAAAAASHPREGGEPENENAALGDRPAPTASRRAGKPFDGDGRPESMPHLGDDRRPEPAPSLGDGRRTEPTPTRRNDRPAGSMPIRGADGRTASIPMLAEHNQTGSTPARANDRRAPSIIPPGAETGEPRRLPATEPPPATASPTHRVDEVMAWLDTHRLQSDERFAESRIHARAARYGDLRIRDELRRHGIALDAEAARALRDTEGTRALAVWERRFGAPATSPTELAKQARFLGARGFSPEAVRQVLRRTRASAAGQHPLLDED